MTSTETTRRVVKPNTLDEITEGDRVQFYHPASNRDQWGDVLSWTVAATFPGGTAAAWDAVLLVRDLGLGNGFSAGQRVVRDRFRRHDSCGVRFAYTPGIYL